MDKEVNHELVIIIRPSFKKFCGADACRAAIFNHLLYWISKKCKGQAEDKIKSGEIYWYGTAEEICAGLDHSWSVNKIRKEVKALVEDGLIGQRRNPVKGWDQTRHYFIGIEQGEAIRKACEQYDICLHCLGLTSDVLHLLNLVNAFHKSGNCNCQKEEMELPNKGDAFTKNGSAIPKVSTKVPSKKTNKEREDSDDLQHDEEPSIDQSPSPFSLEELELLKWYKQLEPGYEPKVETAKRSLPALLEHIHSFEDLRSLHALTQSLLLKSEKLDKMPYLGNMKDYLPTWLKGRIDRTLESIEPPVPALSEAELDRVVLWTRQPDHSGTIEEHYDLYCEMTLREAKMYKWDFYTPIGGQGPLDEETRAAIVYAQQRECITMA